MCESSDMPGVTHLPLLTHQESPVAAAFNANNGADDPDRVIDGKRCVGFEVGFCFCFFEFCRRSHEVSESVSKISRR